MLSDLQKYLMAATPEIISAAKIIRDGGIGGMPTETVYGLAADATNAAAVRRIFEAKLRPFVDPLIVHVCSLEQAEAIAFFTPEARSLAREFWPGPLTMILPRKPPIGDIVTAGLDTVAIRFPANPYALALIRESGRPIAAPSANPFGYVSPTTAAHVVSQLGKRIDFVLDGGECRCGVESTIVLMTSKPKKLLRPGPIPPADIEKVLGEPLDRKPKHNPAHPQAPGMLKTHYSPTHTLRLFDDPAEIPADFEGEIIFLKRPKNPEKNHFWLSEDGNLNEAAHNLFSLLRALDKTSTAGFYCQRASDDGIGLAINDRLSRAAAKM